jgi:hypothetical protein
MNNIIAYFKCKLFNIHTYTFNMVYDPKLGRMVKIWSCKYCGKLVTERDNS